MIRKLFITACTITLLVALFLMAYLGYILTVLPSDWYFITLGYCLVSTAILAALQALWNLAGVITNDNL